MVTFGNNFFQGKNGTLANILEQNVENYYRYIDILIYNITNVIAFLVYFQLTADISTWCLFNFYRLIVNEVPNDVTVVCIQSNKISNEYRILKFIKGFLGRNKIDETIFWNSHKWMVIHSFHQNVISEALIIIAVDQSKRSVVVFLHAVMIWRMNLIS